ncbi:hypothetical protein B0T25DRAFT_615576 [Lasiosphaeria hispida]|uniref:2EXR domain-containing protein n=1 Tax=Lasiosphaeria hispida TaxID=260671 RepID=A0AAJ0H9A5_9PEZI|nr:hypothetical protein B0T25DRAFT_615576 [Lasiosphaeria hispida]
MSSPGVSVIGSARLLMQRPSTRLPGTYQISPSIPSPAFPLQPHPSPPPPPPPKSQVGKLTLGKPPCILSRCARIKPPSDIHLVNNNHLQVNLTTNLSPLTQPATMFESWYARHDEKTKFWLDFQVIRDGLEAPSTPLTTVTGPQTFPLFPTLPTELRLKIWGSLVQPRIILAACFDSRFAGPKRSQLASRPHRRAVPILLHVCQESRALAQKHYALTFSWKVPPRLAAPEAGGLPGAGPARVWFNFAQDALLLLGELEPFDQYGFNSPMVYFLRKDDTRRVRHVAVAYEELHLGVYESEQIFGCLFHIVDRFPAAQRLLVTSTPADAEVRHLDLALPSVDNVIQKLWWAWISGTSIVASSLANKQILMIREADLPSFIAHHG